MMIGDKVIKAHKIILPAAIPYFGDMFSAEMKKEQSGKVELKDLDAGAVEMIIQHVYT